MRIVEGKKTSDSFETKYRNAGGIIGGHDREDRTMKHRKMNRTYYWMNSGHVGWLKKHWKKITLISALSVSLIAASAVSGLAAGRGGQMNGGFREGFGGGFMGGMMGQTGEVTMAEGPSEIVISSVENVALSLNADLENAVYLQMSDSENKIKIEEPGTYVISGECADGSITVKKTRQAWCWCWRT